MANRFDTPYGQKYTSTYVPMPLEEIGNMAKEYSNRYKTGQQLPQKLDLLDEALKAAPIHTDKKKALLTKYKGAMNDIVENAKPEDYAKPDFQNKVNNVLYQFKNDPEVNQIVNTKAWWDKEYMPYVNDDKNNRSLIYGIHETSPGVYAQTNKEISKLQTTPYADRYDQAHKIVGGIKENGDLKESGYDFSKPMQVGPGGEYYAYNKVTKGYEGVTKGKLGEVVSHSIGLYGDSVAGKHHLQDMLKPYLGEAAYNLDYSTLQRKAIDDPQSAEILKAVDQEFQKYLFDTGFKQVGGKSTFKLDNMTLKDDAQARANKAQQDALGGLPQTAPDTSQTDNLIAEIPEGLKDIVSYDKQADGSYKAKVNLDNLGKDIPQYGPNAVLMDLKPGDLKGDSKRLLSYLFNAAEALGVDKRTVTIGGAAKLLDQYHEYAKNISPQEILEGPIQKVLSTNIQNDRGQNYTIYDDEGQIVNTSGQERMADFKVNSRTYVKGKQIIKGSYYDDDDKLHTVTVRPHSNQANSYFGTVGGLKDDALSFFKEGKVTEQAAANIKSFDDMYKEITGDKKSAFDSPGYKGLKPVSVAPLPGVPGQYIIGMSNKEDRTNVDVYLVDLRTGTKSPIPGGLDGATQYISNSWYQNTPEGGREAIQLSTAKEQYTEVTGNK